MTFFSSTDIATLKEEGSNQNHFVSLIVNNEGKYTAAITRKVEYSTTGESIIKYNTFNNELIEGETVPFEQKSYCLEYYFLNVTVQEVPPIVKDELELRLEEVRESSRSIVNKKYNYQYNWQTKSSNSNYTDFTYSDYNNTDSNNNNHNNTKYTQLTLFNDKEFEEEKSNEKLIYTNLDESIPYDKVHLNKEIIENTIKQIVTGDIFSIYKSNIDFNKWKSNIDTLYNKRFNTSESDSFKYWVDNLLDFIESEIKDDNLEKKEGREVLDAIWAYETIKELDGFPNNKYIDYFIKSLERWLI